MKGINMKVIGITGVIALVGVLGCEAALAKDLKYDGNELLAQCQSYIRMMDGEKNLNYIEAGACSGFVQGVNGTVQFYSEVLQKDYKYCLSDGVTNAQLVRIVVKYAKDNPKLLNRERTGLVWSALMDAFPCK